jgi:hypothetical protein
MTTVSCACGRSTITLRGEPLLRVACHCTLCQRFNNAPFGDIVLFRDRDVQTTSGTALRYLRLLPALLR